ncbi:MAG: sugar transferase [Bacilli bacterium]|nr:sugar transferase [Bacilli bacterium]
MDNSKILTGDSYMTFIKAKKAIYLLCKRIIDIIISLVGLILLLPVTIIVKIAYMCTGDFNSIFFTQDRIGKDGKIFKFYKFRSMVPNADEVLFKKLAEDEKLREEYSMNKKLKNDPRITKIGRIIRKSSIDEMPQFINIFLGDMSLIGNRPYLPREKKDMGKAYDTILRTKPGLTGYWQTSGRSDLSFKKRLELEKYYSEHSGFKLDIKIFFKTFKVLLSGKGAD